MEGLRSEESKRASKGIRSEEIWGGGGVEGPLIRKVAG